MKPSTLIQILTDGGIEGSQAAVVGVVLTSLRCDKCKNWRHLHNSELGACVRQDGRWLPYDFCSRWDKKDA